MSRETDLVGTGAKFPRLRSRHIILLIAAVAGVCLLFTCCTVIVQTRQFVLTNGQRLEVGYDLRGDVASVAVMESDGHIQLRVLVSRGMFGETYRILDKGGKVISNDSFSGSMA